MLTSPLGLRFPLPLGPLLAIVVPLSQAACGDVVTEGTGGGGNGGGGNGGGGSGGGDTTASTTSSEPGTTSSSSGSTTTTGTVVSCAEAGGTCVPLVPDACENGMWLDAGEYSCGGGEGVGCCLLAVCTPGQDQTCNANPAMSSLAGHCNEDGTCTCNPGFTKTPEGKCE